MKRAVLILLMGSTLVWGQKTRLGQKKPVPDPTDYSTDLHVQSSHMKVECGDVTGGSNVCFWYQYLSVTVDGKKLELRGNLMTKAE
jgi:hypothetical protein